MISALYYESLVTKIMAAAPDVTGWSFQDGVVFTPCEGNYPSLFFMFSQKWIEVNSKDYMFPISDDG